MSTYREIADTEVGDNAPLTSLLVSALRDNLEAVIAADDTAPQIKSAALEASNRTWKDPGRSGEVDYHNTTGGPIQVALTIIGQETPSTGVQVSADGTNWLTLFSNDSADPKFVSFTVNDGSYHRVTRAAGVVRWLELRP